MRFQEKISQYQIKYGEETPTVSSDSSLLSNTLSNHTKSDNEPIERGRNEGTFYESNDSEFIEEEMIILVSLKVCFQFVRITVKVNGLGYMKHVG